MYQFYASCICLKTSHFAVTTFFQSNKVVHRHQYSFHWHARLECVIARNVWIWNERRNSTKTRNTPVIGEYFPSISFSIEKFISCETSKKCNYQHTWCSPLQIGHTSHSLPFVCSLSYHYFAIEYYMSMTILIYTASKVKLSYIKYTQILDKNLIKLNRNKHEI